MSVLFFQIMLIETILENNLIDQQRSTVLVFGLKLEESIKSSKINGN